ncbi:hypothetical protein ID866_4674 [Astraeus odoratus]|nr:hypothetical protein ID866_4674 [Astraeus odoratus]
MLSLMWRLGKEKWSLPRGPEAQCCLKELCEVFTHLITKVWNHDLAWKVVDIMDAHTICFMMIDVVCFKKVRVDKAPKDEEGTKGEEEDEDKEMVKAKKPDVSPVTIWIGVFPDSTTTTAAHNAAQDVLALLRDYQITDININYHQSLYTHKASGQLLQPVHDLNPLISIVRPLTPTLGLHISTKASPNTQGMMALYLAEGGDSNNL